MLSNEKTVQTTLSKQVSIIENDPNNLSNSNNLVTKEPLFNGNIKTVGTFQEYLSQNDGLELRKNEPLNIKIYRNPAWDIHSPSLRKDLDEARLRKEQFNNDNENKVLSPMLIINENFKENEEEEEKK